VMVDMTQRVEMFKKLTEIKTLLQIFYGDTHVGGYTELLDFVSDHQ